MYSIIQKLKNPNAAQTQNTYVNSFTSTDFIVLPLNPCKPHLRKESANFSREGTKNNSSRLWALLGDPAVAGRTAIKTTRLNGCSWAPVKIIRGCRLQMLSCYEIFSAM